MIDTNPCVFCDEARGFGADAQAYDSRTRMFPIPFPPPPHDTPDSERGSSMVEYVGLGALATMLVTGVAAAVDSAAGDRLGAALVRRLISAISGSE